MAIAARVSTVACELWRRNRGAGRIKAQEIGPSRVRKCPVGTSIVARRKSPQHWAETLIMERMSGVICYCIV